MQDCCAQNAAVVDVGLSFKVLLGECSPGFLAVQTRCGAPFQCVLNVRDCPAWGLRKIAPEIHANAVRGVDSGVDGEIMRI